MNKTVLIAVCDFLVLSALSLSSGNAAAQKSNEEPKESNFEVEAVTEQDYLGNVDLTLEKLKNRDLEKIVKNQKNDLAKQLLLKGELRQVKIESKVNELKHRELLDESLKGQIELIDEKDKSFALNQKLSQRDKQLRDVSLKNSLLKNELDAEKKQSATNDLKLQDALKKSQESKQSLKLLYEKAAELSRQQNELEGDRHKAKQKGLEQDIAALRKQNNKLQQAVVALGEKQNKLPVHRVMSQARREVSVSMEEYDKYDPNDIYSNTLYSPLLSLNGETFVIATFDGLGLSWKELQNDGTIKKHSMALSRRGPNPYSKILGKKILYSNKDARVCLLKVGNETGALSVLGKKNVVNHLHDLWLLKSTSGNLVKLQDVNLDSRNDDYLNIEVRWLGANPNAPQCGDVVVSGDGRVIALLVSETKFRSDNKSVLKGFVLPDDEVTKHFSSFMATPLLEFVKEARKVHKTIIKMK